MAVNCACGGGGGRGGGETSIAGDGGQLRIVVVGGRVESVGGRGLWWRNQIAEELKNLCHEKNY